MRSAGTILGLVVALVIGYTIYRAQLVESPAGGALPKEVVNLTGVKSDLLAIGQAERVHLASHGTYASIEQLQQEGSIIFEGNRRGYTYEAEVDDGQHFHIVAKPSNPAKAGWPTLVIDETMEITQQ